MQRVSCVVLAAGPGTRFGGDKLLAKLHGMTLIERALDAVPAGRLSQVVVVGGSEQVLALARERGFVAVPNELPEEGISRSIRLGVQALEVCDAVLFMVADQPLLRQSRICDLLDEAQKWPESILALSQKGRKGNPCLFPAEFASELLALSGDQGGSAVMQRHPSRVRLVEASPEELFDVDTPEALETLNSCESQLHDMLKPQLVVRFFSDDEALSADVVKALKLVSELGTLRAAADAMELSYSNVWSKIRGSEEALGIQLMERSVGGKRGGGTTLTENAERLMKFYERYCKELGDEADRLLVKLYPEYFPKEMD